MAQLEMSSLYKKLTVWCGPGVTRGVLIFELEFNLEGMKPIATRCLLALATLEESALKAAL